MVNFSLLVEKTLLAEEIVGVPDWFNGLLDKHKELFGVDVTDEDLTDMFDLLDDTKISEQEGLKDLNKIRILDIMKGFYDLMEPQPQDLNAFKDNISSNPNLYQPRISNLLNLNRQSRLNWKLTNPKIIDLKNRTEKLAGQRGADSLLSEYGNDFIIPAVQKIVKKRIDFFTRVANLKSPTTPFANLILDVFKYPVQYKSGAKKYTSDFEEVDKFYIDNLIDIALAAQNFYADEIINLKLTQNVNQSLNFDTMVGDILTERSRRASRNIGKKLRQALKTGDQKSKEAPSTTSNVKQPSQQLNQQPSLSKDTISRLKENILSEQLVNEKINFYLGRPLEVKLIDPSTGEETGNILTTNPQNYKVAQLQKNPRAKDLVQFLSRTAEYSKKKPGAGQRLKQFTQTATAISQFAGM